MATAKNSFDGGTLGADISTANSGGSSGDSFNVVSKGTGAYLDYDNSPVHSGSLSARFHTGATATASRLGYTTKMGSLTTVYGRAYLNIATAPTNAFNLVRIRDASNNALASIELGADRKLRTKEGDAGGFSTIGTAPQAVPTGQWVRLDWKFVVHPTAGHIHLKVYENADSTTFTYDLTDQYTLNTGSGPATQYDVGVTNNIAETGWFRLDDIVWTTTGYPGPADITAPAVPTNLSASAADENTIDLVWDISTDNVGVAGYKVYRDNFASPAVATVTNPGYRDSGRASGTTYNYKVTAYDAAGNESAQSAQASATTPVGTTFSLLTEGSSGTDGTSFATASVSPAANRLLLLSVANGLTGGAAEPSSVTGLGLTWTKVAGQAVQYNRTTFYKAVTGGSPSSGAITISFGATQSSAQWKLVQFSQGADVLSSGTASDSSATNAHIQASLPAAPAAGSVLIGGHSYNSTSNTVTYDSGLTALGTRTSQSTPSVSHEIGTAKPALQTYGAVLSSSALQWAAVAVEVGTPPPSDNTAPSVPAGVTATVVSSSQIDLAWDPSTDNVAVTGYKVYRDNFANPPIATVTGEGYQDTGLSASTTYNYKVTAFDAKGNESAMSTQVSATTSPSPDVTAPTVPTNVSAAAISSSRIDVSWTASTDAVGVTGYNVYRDTFNDPPVATVAGTSFSDTGLTANTLYSYKITAFDAAGNESAQSSSASATTSNPADVTAPTVPTGVSATAVSSSQINVSWTASTDAVGVTGYKVYRDIFTGAPVATVTGTSFSDVGLPAGTTHNYKISAFDAAGNESSQSAQAGATTNAAPSEVDGFMAGWLWSSGPSSRVDSDLGKAVPVVRIFSESWTSAIPDSITTAQNEGRLVIYSVKPPKNGSNIQKWVKITDGSNNASIDTLGTNLKNLGDEMIFIFHHEPHDNAHELKPENEGTDKDAGTAPEYRAAVRYIHDRWSGKGILGKEGGNVWMGYCAGDGGSKGSHNPITGGTDPCYTGGDVIDVLCHDSYNYYAYDNRPWKSFQAEWTNYVKVAHVQRKPLIAGETGSHPGSGGNSRNQWFEDAATWIKTGTIPANQGFPQENVKKWFKGFCYFNRLHEHDWRFIDPSTNPVSTVDDGRTGWRNAFMSDTFFKSTPLSIRAILGGVGGGGGGGGGGTGITFVNSEFNVSAKGANSVTIPKPSGVQSGDVMIALLHADYCTVDHDGPSGWDLITWREEQKGSNPDSNDPPLTWVEGVNTPPPDLCGYAFVKVAGGSEPANYTWTSENNKSGRFIGGTILAFRGVDNLDPIYSFAVNGQTSGLQIRCPSVSSPAGGVLLCAWLHDDPVAIVMPGAMTPVSNFKLPNGGSDDACATAYQMITNAGATGNRVATYPEDKGGDNDMGISVVLRPD